MRSVSTIRPFGNTVRRRFRSGVVIIGLQFDCRLIRCGRFFCPRCSMLDPAVTGNPSQLVQLDADLPNRDLRNNSGAPRPPLFGLDAEALATLMSELGEPSWRRAQLCEAIYRQRVTNVSEISTLSKSLRRKLGESGWEVGRPQITQVFKSVDGTERYLVQC